MQNVISRRARPTQERPAFAPLSPFWPRHSLAWVASTGLAGASGLCLAAAIAWAPVASAGLPGRAFSPSTGGAKQVWHVSNSPKLKVQVATGCPAKVGGFRDVVNTFSGPPLVPAAPAAGLVCRYVPVLATKNPGKLVRSTPLSQAQATKLATLVRKLSLKPPVGAISCPADTEAVALIAFSYSSGAHVALWYHASGCETLDNGAIGSFEMGNPAFYNGFLTGIDKLSPPARG